MLSRAGWAVAWAALVLTGGCSDDGADVAGSGEPSGAFGEGDSQEAPWELRRASLQPGEVGPLRVEVGWCSAHAIPDLHDPRGIWASWGRSPSKRTMKVHYSWVRTGDQPALPRHEWLRACRLGHENLECQTIYDRRPGHPPIGDEPPWTEVEAQGRSTANQETEVAVDWGDGARKGDVLFLRVNDESVATSLVRAGFCPVPYELHHAVERAQPSFVWYGVELDATNEAVAAAGLDLCRDGSRLASEAGKTACITTAGWSHMHEMLERVDRWQLEYMLGELPLVPTTNYHGPESHCPNGSFCGTRVFLERIPGGASYSAPGFLWFPTSKTDIDSANDNGYAGSPSPFRFTSAAAELNHHAAHELFHGLQYAWCRSGLPSTLTAEENCVYKGDPSSDSPPFVVDPWLQGAADGWWTCVDGYVDGDPSNPSVPCASSTRIARRQNLDALNEYNAWLAEPSHDILRWRPSGSEPSYLFWSYLGEQYATARAPTNLSHPLRLPGSTEDTTASRLELDPASYARPLGHAQRRPDEGADIRARVAEYFQGHYGEPAIELLDAALVRHLGRSLRNVMVDLHSTVVLKDYVRTSDDPKEYRRWHLDWLGSHTAGSTQEFFPENPGVAVPSLEQLKAQQVAPFEGMLPVPISPIGRSSLDYTRRAWRVRDSWTGMTCPCPIGAIPARNELTFGEEEFSPTPVHLDPYGMAVLSVAPAARASGAWHLRVRVAGDPWRSAPFDLRVFTVSAGRQFASGGPRPGQPLLLASCVDNDDERELRAPGPIDTCRVKAFPAVQPFGAWSYDEDVLIRSEAENDVREVIAIVSAGSLGADVSWRLGTGSYHFAAQRGPSRSYPARMVRRGGQADALLGPVRVEARLLDEQDEPVMVHPSLVSIRVPGCLASEPGSDGRRCTLAGTDERAQLTSSADGWLRGLVSFPGEWFPRHGSPPAEFDLEIDLGGATFTSLARALRVVDATQGEIVEQSVRSRATLEVVVDSAGEASTDAADGAGRELVGYTRSELIVHALLSDGLPVAGARVTATVTTPSGGTIERELTDDGQTGDGSAGDGHYAALIRDTAEPGRYVVRVRADAHPDGQDDSFGRERLVAVALAEGRDSDGDHLPDWWERRFSGERDALEADVDDDHDGLANALELEAQTNPRAADTDGGGEADGSELSRGADPLDGADDAAASYDLAIAGGNGKVLVSAAVPPTVRALVELERSPTRLGPFEAVPWQPGVDGIVRDPIPNEETRCYRARTTLAGATSDWSPARCATAREDPSTPIVTLGLAGDPPRLGDTVASVRVEGADAPTSRATHGFHAVRAEGPGLADPEAVASGVADMLVSLDPTFSDAVWETYEPVVTVPLSDPTFTVVYAKVRDFAGNESDAASLVLLVEDP